MNKEEELKEHIKKLREEMEELAEGFLSDCKEMDKKLAGKTNLFGKKLHSETIQRWHLLNEIVSPLQAELKGIIETKQKVIRLIKDKKLIEEVKNA